MNLYKKAKYRGRVKVAKYNFRTKQIPQTKGYKSVLVHLKSQKDPFGKQLSPYVLTNDKEHLIENIWQFSKIYESVAAQKIPIHKYNPSWIIWEHPAEKHMVDNEITDEYWKWREKGMNVTRAIRYPNGFKGRHLCKGCVIGTPDDYKILDYIEARKQVYCAEYIKHAPQTQDFIALKKMLENGQNIQIVEVDGPDPTLNYEPYTKISRDNPGLDIDEDTIKMLLNDERKPFGHGYVIAALLLDGQEWLK